MLVAFALCCRYLFYALISYNYFTYVSIPNPRMLMIQARIFVTPYHICREIYESGAVNLSSYLLSISYHHPIQYGPRASWSPWHVWTERHTCIFYTGVSHVPYTCHCMQGQASKGLLLADVWSFHNVQNPSNSPTFSGLLPIGVASREPLQCRIRLINKMMKYGSRDYRLTYPFNIRQVPWQQGDRSTCQMATTQSDISKRESLVFEITCSDTSNGLQVLVTQNCFCKKLLQILELNPPPLDKMAAISQTIV